MQFLQSGLQCFRNYQVKCIDIQISSKGSFSMAYSGERISLNFGNIRSASELNLSGKYAMDLAL